MLHNRDFFLFLNKEKYRKKNIFFFILIIRSIKMSSEHLILADSIKKVHQQLRHAVKQSMIYDIKIENLFCY